LTQIKEPNKSLSTRGKTTGAAEKACTKGAIRAYLIIENGGGGYISKLLRKPAKTRGGQEARGRVKKKTKLVTSGFLEGSGLDTRKEESKRGVPCHTKHEMGEEEPWAKETHSKGNETLRETYPLVN